MEAEHRERAALEQRSLAAVRAARAQWEQQREAEQVAQRERAAVQSEQSARLQATAHDLQGKLKTSTAELVRAQKQLEGLQKLQKDHKVCARYLFQEFFLSLLASSRQSVRR